MAFDFLGTFNKSQFERFLKFARSQLQFAENRVEHLEAERNRVGVVAFTYSGNKAVAYAADPADSYIGKLLAAYEVLGGNPIRDLRTRFKTQPVYLLRGSESVAAHTMSDGSVVGSQGLADAPSAELVRTAKTWLSDTCDHRFDKIERKIRRMMDYGDELQAEIDQLSVIVQAAEIEGSLENAATEVQALIADPNFRAIYDDGGKDPDGKSAYAPFSEYDVQPSLDPALPNRGGAERPQRQNVGGLVGKGEEGKA